MPSADEFPGGNFNVSFCPSAGSEVLVREQDSHEGIPSGIIRWLWVARLPLPALTGPAGTHTRLVALASGTPEGYARAPEAIKWVMTADHLYRAPQGERHVWPGTFSALAGVPVRRGGRRGTVFGPEQSPGTLLPVAGPKLNMTQLSGS